MLTQERYREILSVLNSRGTATVTELSQLLGISESTVRRDLIALDQMEKLQKVRGGAVSVEHNYMANEEDVQTKERLHVEEKTAIGRYAASQINDNDFVYLDAGTTTEKMIDFLENKKATYVTNGIVHAKRMIQRGLRTYIIAGQLKLATEAIVGAVAVSSIKSYHFTKAFMGTNGVSLTSGFTTPDSEEALLKREVMARSYLSYVLADSSKFGRISSVTFSELDAACVITDLPPDPKYTECTVIKPVMTPDRREL